MEPRLNRLEKAVDGSQGEVVGIKGEVVGIKGEIAGFKHTIAILAGVLFVSTTMTLGLNYFTLTRQEAGFSAVQAGFAQARSDGAADARALRAELIGFTGALANAIAATKQQAPQMITTGAANDHAVRAVAGPGSAAVSG